MTRFQYYDVPQENTNDITYPFRGSGGVVIGGGKIYYSRSLVVASNRHLQCVRVWNTDDISSLAEMNAGTDNCVEATVDAHHYSEMAGAAYYDKFVSAISQRRKSWDANSENKAKLEFVCLCGTVF